MVVFFRRTSIGVDGYHDATYSDLSDGNNTSTFISGGVRKRQCWWNIKLADRPAYGAADMIGSRLYLYPTEVQLYSVPSTLNEGDGTGIVNGKAIKLYKAKDLLLVGTEVNEGDTELANSDILQYASNFGDTPIVAETFTGTTFYTENDDTSISFTSGVKTKNAGEYIYLHELHTHQQGTISKLSKKEIYSLYATRPRQFVGTAGPQEMGGFQTSRGSDTYWGRIIGDGMNMINSYNPIPDADIPDGAELDNAQIMIERKSHLTSPVDATRQGLHQIGSELVNGTLYHANSIWKSLPFSGGDDAGWYEDLSAPSYQVKKKLGPKIGNQIFTNDIFVYDTDVQVKNLASDVIDTIDDSLPTLTAPDPNTFVTTRNSTLDTIKKSPNISFEGTGDDNEQRYDIAQSNIVYTQEGDLQNCLMENIYAHSATDATQAAELRTINSTIGYLQETRIQKYIPAPLNIWPEDISFQPHPYIDIPLKIQLPPAFGKNGEGNAKTRLRRALFIGFTRYPLSQDTDMLQLLAGAHGANFIKQSYGFVIYRSGLENDRFYTISSWHDVDTTDTNDPYIIDNDDGGHTGTKQYGFLSRDEVENNYVLLRLSCTFDGVKASFLKPNAEGGGMKSILMGNKSTHTAETSDRGTPAMEADGYIGVPYFDITGQFAIAQSNGSLGTSYDHRDYSQARRYHIKSGLAGTRGSDTTQLNAWKKDMSPGGDWDDDSCGISGGANAQKSASLPYMWSPYLTIATTNTRYNADATNWPDGTSSAEVNQSLFNTKMKDTISRVYLDSIIAHRFNYSHTNASVNSGNINRSALVIPPRSPYTFLKTSPENTPFATTATGKNEDGNLAGAPTATGPINYTYISLGFKNKTDIAGAQKYLLFNGYTQSLSATSEPVDGYDAMMYSAESEPMGEFHHRIYSIGSDESIQAYTPSRVNTFVGAGPADQNTNQGLPLLKYSFFGNTNYGYNLSTYKETRDRNTSLIAVTSNGYFPNNSGLQQVDGATVGGWDALGVNRVEKFNQAGILSINITDDDTTGPSEAELGAKIYCHPSTQGHEGTATNNVNGSTNYDTYKFDVGYNASNSYAASTWHTSWGLYQQTKQGVSTTMPDFCLPNFNWMVKWASDTNTSSLRGDIGIITGVDADGHVHMGKQSISEGPNTDDYGYLFPGFFVKRENPFVQARIKRSKRITSSFGGNNVNDPETWEITVDSDSVLTNADDEIYIVYRASSEWIPSIENYHGTTNGWNHRGESTSIKRQNNNTAVLCKVKHSLGNGKFEIVGCNAAGETGKTDGTSNSMDIFDGIATSTGGSLRTLIWDGSVDPSSDRGNGVGLTGHNVPRGRFLNSNICISPYRYWLYLRVPQQDYEKNFNAICEITSSTDSDFSQEAGQADCVIQSTYNESQFTDSPSYNNYWSWNPKSTESHLDIGVDYGFGAFDATKGSGGYCGVGNVNKGKYNRFSIDGVARTGSDSSQEITIIGMPYEHDDVMYKFDSAEGTNPPYLLTVFSDELPNTPTDFKVKPDEDSAFYPKFTWSASDDDLWYGFMIIDTKPIKNQYHGCVLHLPLNETDPSSTVTKYYRPDQNVLYKSRDAAGAETQSGFMTVSGSAVHSEEGLAGNCLEFDGTDDSIELTSASYTAPTTEMAISLHVRPDTTPTNNKTLLEKQYEYSIELDTNQQIIAKVWADTGSNGTATDIPVELKSISAIPCDRDTPSNVILIVDTGLKYGNVKLYIDGKLEDQSGLKKTEGSANNWPIDKNIGYRGAAKLYIGRNTAGDGGSFFDGKMEEITIYNRVILPVTPSDGELLFTKPVSELSTATEAVSKSYGAKLFIKDYHNIRGVSRTEVCSTAQISFRKAAFRLNTT